MDRCGLILHNEHIPPGIFAGGACCLCRVRAVSPAPAPTLHMGPSPSLMLQARSDCDQLWRNGSLPLPGHRRTANTSSCPAVHSIAANLQPRAISCCGRPHWVYKMLVGGANFVSQAYFSDTSSTLRLGRVARFRDRDLNSLARIYEPVGRADDGGPDVLTLDSCRGGWMPPPPLASANHPSLSPCPCLIGQAVSPSAPADAALLRFRRPRGAFTAVPFPMSSPFTSVALFSRVGGLVPPPTAFLRLTLGEEPCSAETKAEVRPPTVTKAMGRPSASLQALLPLDQRW